MLEMSCCYNLESYEGVLLPPKMRILANISIVVVSTYAGSSQENPNNSLNKEFKTICEYLNCTSEMSTSWCEQKDAEQHGQKNTDAFISEYGRHI